MTEDIEKLKKSARINRALLIILIILFLVIIAGLGVVALYAYNMTQKYMPIARKLTEIDWTLMSDRISRLNPADLHDKIDTIQADLDAIKEALATFH